MTIYELYDLIYIHLRERWHIYAIVLIFSIPIIYFTRRWSLPFIFYTIETAIYITIMHIVTHYFVIVVAWYKENTDMKALRPEGVPAEVPDWATPLIDFWNKEAYIPPWILYVEIALAIIITFLVFRYRPPTLGYIKSKRAKIREKQQEALQKEREERKARYIDDFMP